MARLIDADALMKEHCDGCSLDLQESCTADPSCASMMWIVEAPTVDAVPVVHGRWIERKEIFSENEGEVDAIGCSKCGKSQRKYRGTNYCPNCGAKMDGDGERRIDGCKYNTEVLCNAYACADHLIANGVTIQRWIPVTERLPDKLSRVLALTEWKVMIVARHTEVGWVVAWNNAQCPKITHWMPLPEGPKDLGK